MAYRLRLHFDDAGEFRKEFERNLAMGGTFVTTGDALELRTRVEVELVLGFCDARVCLEAEVVHLVPPEHALNPTDAGVAVAFLAKTSEIREKLEPYLDAQVPAPDSPDTGYAGPTCFEAGNDPAEPASLSPLETSLLELASAGLCVARMVEVIPEDEGDIQEALASLVERGALRATG